MRDIEIVTTHEIRLGDVILSHGMELLIDREPTQSKAHGVSEFGGVCMWTQARVLNWDYVQEHCDSLLVHFIREDMSEDSHRTRNGLPPHTEPRWTIQGNGLAQWSRVKKES